MARARVMVGRQTELDALVSLAEGARRQGEVTLAVVAGEAGIGKSRLVSEATALMDDALVLTSHGIDMATGEIPFGVMADLVRDLLRQHGPAALADSERRDLGPLLPGGHRERDIDRIGLLTAGLTTLERLARDRLLVWVVEDLHCVDTPTRDLLLLVAGTAAGRLLVVVTVRTDDPARQPAAEVSLREYVDRLVRLSGGHVLLLRRLSATEVVAQLGGISEKPTPAAVSARIARLSDGIPFLVEELAATDARPELTTAAAAAAARLIPLGADARRLVEAAAVGDGHLRTDLVEEVADLPDEELDEALRGAIGAGVLVEDLGSDSLAFRHALLREAVDRSLQPAARRGWHRRWAEVLEQRSDVLGGDPVTLAIAEHWRHAGDRHRELPAAVAAARAAARIGGPEQTHHFWVRVLELWTEVPDAESLAGVGWRDALTEVLAGFRGMSVKNPTWAGLVRRIRAATTDRSVAAAITLALEGSGLAKGELSPRRPREETRQIEADLRSGPPDRLFVGGLIALGLALAAEYVADGVALMHEARRLARELGDRSQAELTYVVESFLREVAGQPADAMEVLMVGLAEASPEDYRTWRLDGNLIYCLAIQGRYTEADAAWEQAIQRPLDRRAAGDIWEHLVENIALVWLETGRWHEVVDLVEGSQRLWAGTDRYSDLRLEAVVLRRTGSALRFEHWSRSLDEPDVPGGPDRLPRIAVVAEHLGRTGDLAAMRDLVAEVWQSRRAASFSDLYWPLVREVVRLEVGAAVADPGEQGQAMAHLAVIAELVPRLHHAPPFTHAVAAELVAQSARLRGEPCVVAFREALSRWQALRNVYDAAVCRLCLAEQLAPEDRQEAAAQAQAALDTARSLGAEPLAAQCEALLTRLVPQRRTSSVLTAREAEVLALLAEGRTNGEIARELFISTKTASVHVSRILQKLGAANRTEAAAIARRDGLA